MKYDQVTSVYAPQIVPVLYLDLDTAYDVHGNLQPTQVFLQGLAMFPGLMASVLTQHGPDGGNPVYRVEGPLPELTSWLVSVHNNGDLQKSLDQVKRMKLAR
jgi:hypothetical protein